MIQTPKHKQNMIGHCVCVYQGGSCYSLSWREVNERFSMSSKEKLDPVIRNSKRVLLSDSGWSMIESPTVIHSGNRNLDSRARLVSVRISVRPLLFQLEWNQNEGFGHAG